MELQVGGGSQVDVEAVGRQVASEASPLRNRESGGGRVMNPKNRSAE